MLTSQPFLGHLTLYTNRLNAHNSFGHNNIQHYIKLVTTMQSFICIYNQLYTCRYQCSQMQLPLNKILSVQWLYVLISIQLYAVSLLHQLTEKLKSTSLSNSLFARSYLNNICLFFNGYKQLTRYMQLLDISRTSPLQL